MPLGSIQVCESSFNPWPQERRAAAPKPMEDMLACPSRPMVERRLKPQPEQVLKCPRCDSTNTKFCYYNNYSLSQPRYFCKNCRRYWTKGGSLRNVPIGGGCRKNRRSKRSSSILDPTDHIDPKKAPSSAASHANTVNDSNNHEELTNACPPLIDRACNILNVGFPGSLYNFGSDDINLPFARIPQATARLGSSDHRSQPSFANCNSSGYVGMAARSGPSTLMEGLPPMPSLPALNFLHSLKSNPFNSDAFCFNPNPIPFRRVNSDIHESSTPAAHLHGDLNMNSLVGTHPRAQISEATAGIRNFDANPFTLTTDIHGINGVDIPDAVTHWTTVHQSAPLEPHGQELSEQQMLKPVHPKSEVLESAEDQSSGPMPSEWRQQQRHISPEQTVFDTVGKDSMYWNINAGAWPHISATNYASPLKQQQQH